MWGWGELGGPCGATGHPNLKNKKPRKQTLYPVLPLPTFIILLALTTASRARTLPARLVLNGDHYRICVVTYKLMLIH